MKTAAGRTEAGTIWGSRAASLYTAEYAERYRASDETDGPNRGIERFAAWIHGVANRFDHPIDVLDLGCGTGRYFRAVAHARRLVGIDISRPMLERARRPAGVERLPDGWLSLVQGDLLTHEFAPGEFDFVYSIGVLGEHSPFDERIVGRVHGWLRPGGRFAVTTVDPLSPSVPATFKRRVGRSLLALPSEPLRRVIRRRLMRDGLYADESRVRDVLTRSGFAVESVEPFDSNVHHHVLAVARKDCS